MFREVARKKQVLPREECIRLLEQERRGVLSVLGDDGYPYGMPMNFWYEPETGYLIFHGGLKGHKIDAIRRCDKVSFCTWDAGTPRPGDWALDVRSVVVFGRIRVIDDYARAMEVSRKLSLKYTADTAYIEKEILESGPHTLCLELIPEHITGKLVNES